MKRIVTLTLNPAIDAAAEAEIVRPIRKIRTWGERYDPGGGGINVARVVQELGGQVLAVYLAGGLRERRWSRWCATPALKPATFPSRGTRA